MKHAIQVLIGLILGIGGLLFLGSRRWLTTTRALVITRHGKTTVHFQPRWVIPFLHTAEEIDLAIQPITVVRSGREGLICRDSVRVDVRATFLLRVRPDREAIRQVAQSVGCQQATDPDTLHRLFHDKFVEALSISCARLNFETILQEREMFREYVIEVLGVDPNGYLLDDVAIGSIEQTPLEALDPDNIVDARGIARIKALTTELAAGANGKPG